MKPLFIPLKREYFEMFARGEKTSELRLYGPRWNEKTCALGRAVVLSLGYGKQHRLTGCITGFQVCNASSFYGTTRASIQAIFGTLDKPIAEIRLSVGLAV